MRTYRTQLLLGLAALALPAAAASQRTWIVDLNNRPGTNFTDLPPAVAAAAAGDTLLIRHGGPYTNTVIDKGLTLAPEVWRSAWWVAGDLTVQGLPPGQRCVIKRYFPTCPGDGILCLDNEGAIHLEDVLVGIPIIVPPPRPSFTFKRCKQVTLANCRTPFLIATDSTIVVGGQTRIDATLSILTLPTQTEPFALSATNSRIIIADSTISGSAGDGDPYSCSVLVQPGPAIKMSNSHILIADAGSVRGASLGFRYCGQLAAAPAAFGSGTITTPSGILNLFGGVQGNITVTQRATPDQSALVNWPGGFLDAHVHATPGAPAATLVSLPLLRPTFSCPWCIGPHGWPGLWLDVTAFGVLAVGNVDQAGLLSVKVPIPPTFPRIPLAVQSFVLNGTALELSTAAVAITAPQGSV